MRKIEVVAAILQREDSYFATQRGYGAMEGMWEFPGGKIEPGEHPEAALHRELQEELGIEIAIEEHLCTTDYDYPDFHLTLRCYLCRIAAGKIELREHKAARWLRAEELDEVAWLPADKEAIELLKRRPRNP
ncbi:MAG: (deoxy)nucleoside triphosphate pyrophosphohydrolase [Rikenellaceae bacterium]|nr:(deoxy)nucleoside triphosphate pyrophosphohydrolase [Rikenellaceae bacterium]